MISDLESPWSWQILGPLFRSAFSPIPDTPLPIWASREVFLDRKITTKPGFYDPEEFGWTWEFHEILRTRAYGTIIHPLDGALCQVDSTTPGSVVHSIERMAVMKLSVTGFPDRFKVIVFVDRDAKNELYCDRITAWVDWLRHGQHLPPGDEKRVAPDVARLYFPEDLRRDDEFAIEHSNERLVEITSKDKGWMPHAAKQFV